MADRWRRLNPRFRVARFPVRQATFDRANLGGSKPQAVRGAALSKAALSAKGHACSQATGSSRATSLGIQRPSCGPYSSHSSDTQNHPPARRTTTATSRRGGRRCPTSSTIRLRRPSMAVQAARSEASPGRLEEDHGAILIIEGERPALPAHRLALITVRCRSCSESSRCRRS